MDYDFLVQLINNIEKSYNCKFISIDVDQNDYSLEHIFFKSYSGETLAFPIESFVILSEISSKQNHPIYSVRRFKYFDFSESHFLNYLKSYLHNE